MNTPHPFVNPQDLGGQIPKLVHRTLLYDEKFPANVIPYLKRFYEAHKDFTHVLWKKQDVLRIMSKEEQEVYNGYEKNVQRADFARYVILRELGGIYADFDIDIKTPLHALFEEGKNADAVVFIEERVTDSYLEYSKWFNYRGKVPESRLRVGQCVMFAKPHSRVMSDMVQLCMERSKLKVLSDKDILFTTGPDIARTIVGKFVEAKDDTVIVIDKDTADKYFIHTQVGHWRGK